MYTIEPSAMQKKKKETNGGTETDVNPQAKSFWIIPLAFFDMYLYWSDEVTEKSLP